VSGTPRSVIWYPLDRASTRGQNMQLRCARSPERTAAALQVQQSPRSSTCPTHHAESVGVVVVSRGRIALALAQRENSIVGSPKSAVSPRPPRRNSGAARTAPFSEARAAFRSFIRTAPCIVVGSVSDLVSSHACTCDPACALCRVWRPARCCLRLLALRRRERCSLLRAF
jgi:hypothetical protein